MSNYLPRALMEENEVRREEEKEAEDKRTGSLEAEIGRIQRRLDKGTEVTTLSITYVDLY
jgi:hypothetical protein